jgi:hypothetical protein
MAKLSAIASIAALIAALGSALAAAGCSNVLGLKDPTFNDTGHDASIDTPPIDAPIDMGPAACMPSACPFGCDPTTNACRPAKLWVYLTTHNGSPQSFLGDGFGGKSSPPNVRATTDTLCFANATENFPGRACSRDRSHAILTISGSDTIPTMAVLYGIPTTVEVHRADDDVLVANNWNDLTDTTKAPRAPVASAASAATEALGIVWTGTGGANTCGAWTSEGSTTAANDNGVRGHTTLMFTTWMVRDTSTCNLVARLLCVCWSGGQ